ncbi:MAG: head-tail connector protein [Lachnospiraceae bacterium]|nr:head-tail connector protein [Lachnospiraceae bacterium]
MKVSGIEVNQVAEYLRLDDYEYDEIAPLLDSARAFIRSYTGLKDEEIDEHEDFYIVAMILCQDMYDNRCMYVDKNNLNKVVDTILGMHCVNLL